MKRLYFLFICILVLFSLFPSRLYAKDNSFVTIINPVRISEYTPDVSKSIEAQYSIVKERDLSATWLLTYDVLQNHRAIDVIKKLDKNQEIGIFFEISEEFSENAGIDYNICEGWHEARCIFLTGYSRTERTQLIDSIFVQFYKKLGYYPKSVGAWWIDGESLQYMHDKYGVTGNLGLADQFSTDGYQVWGTYWSSPYFSRKTHAGMPSKNKNDAAGVVTVEWAPRDPFNGYESSLYSTQDYFVKDVNQGESYFEKLVRLYTSSDKNGFGQIVVGLEGDFTPDAYQNSFRKQMDVIKKLKNEGQIQDLQLSQFSEWYISQFKYQTPSIDVVSDDLLNSNNKSIWMQTPFYRLGIRIDENGIGKIIDLRAYYDGYEEPYLSSQHNEKILYINTPSLIDSYSDKKTAQEIPLRKYTGHEKTDTSSTIYFEEGKIVLTNDTIGIEGRRNIHIFDNYDNQYVSLMSKEGKQHLQFTNRSFKPYTFQSLDEVGYRTLTRKRNIVLFGIYIIVVATIFVLTRKRFLTNWRIRWVFMTFLLLSLAYFSYWLVLHIKTYYVSREELVALEVLNRESEGDVLVYDKACLGCDWDTEFEPSALINKRGYVKKYSKKNIIQNHAVFNSIDRSMAQKEFDKTGAKYIYITKYKENFESVPFSPGDLGIEKVFENAYSQIWRKVE